MSSNIIHVQKWSEVGKPTETGLHRKMAAEGLSPYRWSGGPKEVFHAHEHAFDKVIFVVEGSITFGFPIEGEPTTLLPGDRLELPAGVLHNAVAGANGVVCLEARRNKG